jgi:hypothetical protein
MSAEKYPTLLEMGIEEPHEVERYTSRIEGDMDILKIYFHRHQGEWMTKSKKFKFKRQHKNMRVNEGRVPYIATTESSPYFLRAIAELDTLVTVEKTAKDRKQRLLEDIEHLEKVVARKLEDMRRQIEEM